MSLLLPFRQEMAIVLPVVSLATGDRNAPKVSVQDLKVICRVTDDRMMMEKVCLTILLVLPVENQTLLLSGNSNGNGIVFNFMLFSKFSVASGLL